MILSSVSATDILSGMIDYENEDRDTFDYAGILETPHFWPQMSGRENLQYYLRDKYNDERAFKLIKKQIETVLEHGILIRLDGESISDIVRKLCSYNIVGVLQKKRTLKTLYKEEMQR